jgi:hypothetical protein
VTAWRRIVGVLRILAELGRRIELDHGEWQQLKIHGVKLGLLRIVDKYESPNVVYQSEGHPILIIFCCCRILQQS